MSASLETAQPTRLDPPADAKTARRKQFERDQVIVEYLNRGVSVAEIAMRFDVSEKRMRANIREILARRMPAPPEEFVAVQVSRLNEALLVAYSAMTDANLKAVDRVVRIVRELDRYHGFAAAERRRSGPAPRPLQPPAQAIASYGPALVCVARLATEGVDTARFEQGAALVLASPEQGEGGPSRDDLARAPRAALAERDDRPTFPPQVAETMDSAPGYAAAVASRAAERRETAGSPGAGVVDAGAEAAFAGRDDRPTSPAQVAETMGCAPGSAAAVGAAERRETAGSPGAGVVDAGAEAERPNRDDRPQNPPEAVEDIDFAPGVAAPSGPAPALAHTAVVRQTAADGAGLRRVNVRMIRNGMMAC
ncbi:hypothetical protein DFR50_11353 [Roseiarcus fermentans]|uniref:Homeodomain-like domain-containing protein n=1 Tax=Roseiarcus fermentans TaxID=1473586 RepID=A0A366FDV9_9HYPH|nr:hypothetical protein [Roseiarcus fermentans]RBP12864.1 hypothetical protein DFR50_11353 [Roseiarcus fermentans]